MRKRARVATVLAMFAALLPLTGCFEVAEPTPRPSSAAVPELVETDYVGIGKNEYARQLGNRRFADSDIGFLIGPHFVIRQQSVGTVTEIDDQLAARIGLTRGIRAPAGHEFVIADFARSLGYRHGVPKGGRQPGSLEGLKFRQWVRVGDTYRQLYVNVAGGTLLVVAVPVKERVWLRVDDSGRTQWLDLRTGRRAKDSVTSFYPDSSWTPPAPEDSLGWSNNTGIASGNVSVYTELVDLRAELSPFSPSGTWARRGRAWLYVTFQPQSDCNPVVCRVSFEPQRDIRVQTSRGAGGKPVGPDFASVPSQRPQGGFVNIAVEIPASAKSARLLVSQKGTATAYRGKKTSKLSWRDRPPTITVPLKVRG